MNNRAQLTANLMSAQPSVNHGRKRGKAAGRGNQQKRASKLSALTKKTLSLYVAAACCGGLTVAHAGPKGGDIVGGKGSIKKLLNKTVINQTSHH